MTSWISDLIAQGGYWSIAFLMALENIFPPIPSELIMGIGGVGVGEGTFHPVALVLVGTIGSVIGNYVWFMVGRHWNEDDLRAFVRKHGRWLTLDVATVNRIDRIFDERGQWVVFFARFIPNIRTMISVPAGLFGMSHKRFILATSAGAAVWNSALVYAGYELQQNVDDIENYLGPVSIGVIGLIVVVYVWRIIFWRPKEG
ncbi:DedA family protein [Sphingorhabdus sp. M41]|uniref:DedA family protein n=1 Tax=Sphingorhabdus sp. M41 TaxID=1806885 RepID=UPI00078BC1C6|nr:DedA family protein [Sphingorhabdus sp. M41]AMO72207.1 alkaline phosphatase [Sphingorhabdus sp. M41]